MSAGALVRAARQQGQRRLLAWRQAVADVRLQQPTAGEEAHNTPHSGVMASASRWDSPCSSSSSSFCSFAAAATPWPAASPGAAAPAWRQLQLRGFAIGRAWRPRRKDVMPDRNLPARNEQIKAKEVGWWADGGHVFG